MPGYLCIHGGTYGIYGSFAEGAADCVYVLLGDQWGGVVVIVADALCELPGVASVGTIVCDGVADGIIFGEVAGGGVFVAG